MIETLHERLLSFVEKKIAKAKDVDGKSVIRLSSYLEALADKDVLARHYTDGTGYECQGCGFDAYEEYRVKDIDDCPEIRARAVAYGLLKPEEVFTWSWEAPGVAL